MKCITTVAATALTGIALIGVPVTAAHAAPAPASLTHHVAVDTARPDTYVVSTTPGENPEGIEVHRGTMYVTSVKTGAVFTGSTKDGRLREFSPAGFGGRTHATGVHVDPYGRVVVAGAMTGALWTYSPSGTPLQRLFAPGVTSTTEETQFLNDFVFANGYVYVTESWTGAVYRARVTRIGYGPLEPYLAATDFPAPLGFLNGIATSADGRYLLVSDWDKNVTYRVDTRTKAVSAVTVTDAAGSPVEFGADGLLLDGHTARGVYSNWTENWTAVRTVRFNRDFTRATLVGDSARATFATSPSTIAWDRGRMLWVNSQLNAEVSAPPYTVTVVPGLR